MLPEVVAAVRFVFLVGLPLFGVVVLVYSLYRVVVSLGESE